MSALPRVRRRKWKLSPGPTQVICRLHLPEDPLRIRRLIDRILALSDAEANELLIPYTMSDINSGMASVNVQELINYMAPVA